MMDCPRCHIEGVYIGDQKSIEFETRRLYARSMYKCPQCETSFCDPVKKYADESQAQSERSNQQELNDGRI